MNEKTSKDFDNIFEELAKILEQYPDYGKHGSKLLADAKDAEIIKEILNNPEQFLKGVKNE